MKLLRESSNSGYVPATHELALRLVRKPEFLSAPGEALENLQKASQVGFWKSTVVLGVLYRDGRGVQKDPETAYLQFRIAALQGGESAAKLVKNDLHVLEAVLDPAHIQGLADKAADWAASHDRRLQFAPYQAGGKGQGTFALAYPEAGLHAGRMFPLGDQDDQPRELFQP